MSQNTDHYQLGTTSSPPSSSSSSSNNKRLPTHQQFLSSPSSDFNTTLSTTQNDSSSTPAYTSPIVNDVCAGNQNGVRNASTTMKINNTISPNDNHHNDKYAFILDFTSPAVKTKKDHSRNIKSQRRSYDMAANDEENLHSPFELDVPLCENQSLKRIQNDFLIDRMLKDDPNSNFSSPRQQRSPPNQSSNTNVFTHASPLLTPSSDHRDIDALSDAGTYIIDDDIDIAHDDEAEQDIEQHNDTQEQEQQQQNSPLSSPFKRYATTKRNRHGTFDIHAISSPSSSTKTHAVNRPIVDLNVPTHDLSSPSSSSSASPANLSSSSSLLSLPTESDNSTRREPEGASHFIIDDKSSTGIIYARQRPNAFSQQQRSITPPQNQLKAAECFVISPTFETKPFPNTTTTHVGPRRKPDSQWKPKSTSAVAPIKDINFEIPLKKSSPAPPSPPLSTRSNQSDREGYSFRLQQTRHHEPKQTSLSSNQKSSLQNSDYITSSSKSSLRSQPLINDQTYTSPFQRNSSIRQTMPANTQYNRALSSSTTNKYLDDNDESLSTHPSLTKVYMNKSFALRRQRSNLIPSTSKPIQQQQHSSQQQQSVSKPLATRQLLKGTPSIPATSLTGTSSTGQTNRAVELRRARAQAKIEELAQRTRQQLQKTEQHNDIMSASWHSNASSTGKKDISNIRPHARATNVHTNTNQLSLQKQDLLKTRTISSSSHHRSSSASPNALGETQTITMKTSKYRRPMTSSVTDESQYQKMNGSTYSEGGRCDSLRDDGQRLAIKLIQLSSGILAKLKPNNLANDDDSNARELEQLVNQLQTVNRTLSTIDASLTGSTSDEALI